MRINLTAPTILRRMILIVLSVASVGVVAQQQTWNLDNAAVESLEVKKTGDYTYIEVAVDQTLNAACSDPTLRLPYDDTSTTLDDNSPASLFYSLLLTAKSAGLLVDISYADCATGCETQCLVKTVKIQGQ